jgi:hypothetical protein
MTPRHHDATTPCEACGEVATRRDREGGWLCDGEHQQHNRFEHLVDYEADEADWRNRPETPVYSVR